MSNWWDFSFKLDAYPGCHDTLPAKYLNEKIKEMIDEKNITTGNWIKPEKCDGPIVNLDVASSLSRQDEDLTYNCGIIFYGCDFNISKKKMNMICFWKHISEEDRDHDYQRILLKLGLQNE